ncbi:uncharacterized protein LOC108472214 [Gossypium arboreum]|uniref:uncharacterized protein LOC108472214 n=1 Tax=Gossypium arboreum TaxID=29729 RepID=UPI0008194A58|nr:uncharacterized protein LOC108472214 [Gossypium arboreum]
MACQYHLVVVALVFIVVVREFAVESSPLPVPSSPLKSPSVSSPAFFPKSPSIKSPAPKSSHPGGPKSSSSSSSPSPSQSDNPNTNKGHSFEVESSEEVSSPPSPTANDEVSDSPSPSPKGMGDVVDSETFASAPTPSNAIEKKATTCIVGVFLSPSPSQSENPNANEGYFFEVESPEEVSSPPSPTANDEGFDSPSLSPKSMGDVVDSETLALAPTPSNAIEIKATTCIVGVVTIFGFFLF